jgi:hypothetical protein
VKQPDKNPKRSFFKTSAPQSQRDLEKRQQDKQNAFDNIFSLDKALLSKMERINVWKYLRSYRNDLKREQRQLVWFYCSGAKSRMLTNPGYYNSLINTSLKYPHPGHAEIEKDLRRSGNGVSEKDVDCMRRILGAFILRNPTVGYCQGMNFITARLLTCLEEEEAFWVLVQIIEELLPLDNYSNLIGVLVDQKVLQHLMGQSLPRLQEYLEKWPEFSIILQQKLFKWLMVLFVGELPLDTEYLVWDLFLTYGSVVLFRVALTILQIMLKAIAADDSYDNIMTVINQGLKVSKKELL